jgi:phosphatidylglycerol:prolipoprotein diacylglycerol transferase
MTEAALVFPNIDPVFIHLGPLAIRWYGLSYFAGLLFGWLYIVKLLADSRLWAGSPFQGNPPTTSEQIGDLLAWVTLGIVVGGRLGYVLFYGTLYCSFAGHGAPACGGLPEAYWHNPITIISTWNGGMSFHGGLVGVVLVLVWFCRRQKLNLLAVGDLIAAATPIGLFFGRIANFVNGELWGKVTDVPWGMVFCNRTILAASGGCSAGMMPRHPSQLYEAALEGLLLFVILRVLMLRWKIHHRPGLVIAWFLTFYGLFRFIVEFFRDSESKIVGWFSMGQALSLPMWAAAAFFFWYALKSRATMRA